MRGDVPERFLSNDYEATLEYVSVHSTPADAWPLEKISPRMSELSAPEVFKRKCQVLLAMLDEEDNAECYSTVCDSLAELLFGEDEVLVAAKDLLNNRSVTRACGGLITYVHLMFDQHEVIETDGLYSESYHPGEWVLTASQTHVRQELFQIFPELETSLSAYGPTCYPSVSVQEARLLIA